MTDIGPGWAGIVEEVGANGDASVVLVGDSTAVWLPLEVPGVSEGMAVAVEFRGDAGDAAVTAVIQTA
ncbi:MAG TPA: hypothetical protein VFU14_20210 [Acidimicrobiales bacterium]|nr:hypothetical protein [Acidimicrobiales bacterium]